MGDEKINLSIATQIFHRSECLFRKLNATMICIRLKENRQWKQKYKYANEMNKAITATEINSFDKVTF